MENIEDWYRNELNNYNVEPDKTVWDSLSKDLDADAPLTEENISEWYKKEVTKLEEKPDYKVWEKLSTKLDTASVWDKLVVSLNRYDQIIWWRNLTFKGTALFLLFFGSYLAYDSYSNNESSVTNILNENIVVEKTATNSTIVTASGNDKNDNISLSKKAVQTFNKNDVIVGNNKSTQAVIANNSVNDNISPEEKVNVAVKDANKTISRELNKNRGRSKYSSSYASLDKIQKHYSSIYKDKLDELKSETEKDINRSIDRHTLTEKDISYMYASGDFLVKKDRNKIVFNSKRFSSYFIFGLYARRIYVGVNSGFKKQGMITSLKNNSSLAEYKQNNLLDFGSNFGGTVGYIISDKFNLEANINLNSTSGYKRAFDGEDLSYQENLNLNYTSISLLAKKMNNKSTFDNKVYSTNLIGGVYASYLRSAVSDVNGVSRSLDEYNKTDFGIVLGIEQDRYITKTLVVTPGVRYNQGLANTANENSPFKFARNFSFEFNLGVKYIFLKKGKD